MFDTVGERRWRLRRFFQDEGVNASRAPSWLAPPRFPPGTCREAEARRGPTGRGAVNLPGLGKKSWVRACSGSFLQTRAGGGGRGGEGCCGEVEAARICPHPLRGCITQLSAFAGHTLTWSRQRGLCRDRTGHACAYMCLHRVGLFLCVGIVVRCCSGCCQAHQCSILEGSGPAPLPARLPISPRSVFCEQLCSGRRCPAASLGGSRYLFQVLTGGKKLTLFSRAPRVKPKQTCIWSGGHSIQ